MSTPIYQKERCPPTWAAVPMPTPESSNHGSIRCPRPAATTLAASSAPSESFLTLALRDAAAQNEEAEGASSSSDSDVSTLRRKKRSVSDAHITREPRNRLISWGSIQSLKELVGAPFTHKTAAEGPAAAEYKDPEVSVFRGISVLVNFLSQPEHLKTKGLFRESGSLKEIDRLEKLILEKGITVPLETDAKTAAGVLLRLYGRVDFPERFTEALMTLSQDPHPEMGGGVDEIIGSLSKAFHLWAVVQEMMYFLVKVESYHEDNLMTDQVLGFSFGQVFYRKTLDVAAAKGNPMEFCIKQGEASKAFQYLLLYFAEKSRSFKSRSSAAAAEVPAKVDQMSLD